MLPPKMSENALDREFAPEFEVLPDGRVWIHDGEFIALELTADEARSLVRLLRDRGY
jgi:hypothetical protein